MVALPFDRGGPVPGFHTSEAFMNQQLQSSDAMLQKRILPEKQQHAVKLRGIERCFDVPFVADMALREKQIQQNYRPVIAVHKWFARRPGTLFRALLLSEFLGESLQETYFRSHSFNGLRVADPFMGGGTPLLEANRIGCDVVGLDINPMAYWIVRQEIEHLDINSYQEAANRLRILLEGEVGHLYRTKCQLCKRSDAHVKYFIWVKTHTCLACSKDFDLFPGFLLAENRRHPKNVIICSTCGELSDVADRIRPGECQYCCEPLKVKGPASRNRCVCPYCGNKNSYPNAICGPPKHRLVAIEYYCPNCRPGHHGRFFKKPDEEDLRKYNQAVQRWKTSQPIYVPADLIPEGDETDRLHRWGYRFYREMFNERQLLGLELICRAVTNQMNERVRNALATNLSDLLRYQNMLCRYDSFALKSLDIFSVHGFPVGLVQCESNLLGIINEITGANIGSGGWSNITDKFKKAKQYCSRPFEITYQAGKKKQIWIDGEWIGESRHNGHDIETRQVDLRCASATQTELPEGVLDMVITDPPYFANVQYAELMDFCYVWLRQLVGNDNPVFAKPSTRNEDELTGNVTMDRGLDHFTGGLSQAFSRMAKALKPGAPFVFTYHHNSIAAYYPIAIALLDANLVCTAAIPCPAEMSSSIHINGTGSSVVDTVFVNRTTGVVSRRIIVNTPKEIAELVIDDLGLLKAGGLKVTKGDARCVIYGHLIRLTVWNMRKSWVSSVTWSEKLRIIAQAVHELGGLNATEKHLPVDFLQIREKLPLVQESQIVYGDVDNEISF
jgi:adenine-specific DNA methylase